MVGAFVLTLAMAFIGLVLWLASGGAVQKKYDVYRAIEDESVSGLNLYAPVKYNGVEVGKVREITLDKINPQRVYLLFWIERGTPIKVSTVATLKTQGLTGIAYVELSGGTAAEPMLQAEAGEPYAVIQTRPSLSARLENILSAVLEKIDSTSSTLNALLSKENLASLQGALTDIAAVSRTIAGRKDAIDSSLLDASRAFKSTAKVADRLDRKMDPLMANVERSLQDLEKMSKALAATSLSAGQTVEAVGADVQRFSGRTLPELDRLLSELNELTESLHRLSEQTGHDPRSLLFGRKPSPPGPGEAGPR